jgi:hypothetical protein
MFDILIVILIESWIKKEKKKRKRKNVFLVSIDYHEYFEIIYVFFLKKIS